MKQDEDEKLIENKHLAMFVILLFVVGIFLVIVSNKNDSKPELVAPAPIILEAGMNTLTENFAACLTNSGAKMYGSFWCSHCERQKEYFAEGWKYINYVECSNKDRTQNKICNDAGIRSYPTWEFEDGSRILGYQEFSLLEAKTNCSLIPTE